MDLSNGKRDVALNLSVDSRYALRVSFWLLEKIIAGWDLGVGVIVSEFNGMRGFTGRRIVASGLPANAVPNGLSNWARFLALLRQILVVRCRVRQAGPTA